MRDRLLETGVLEDWRERVEHDGGEEVPCEIELWHRTRQSARDSARERVVGLVEGLGGTVRAEATIQESPTRRF